MHTLLPKSETAMPGIGLSTTARILLEVGDGSAFATSAHLAAYAGLANPTSRAYYDHKRAQGKRHNAALICLTPAAATSYSPCSTTRPTTNPQRPN